MYTKSTDSNWFYLKLLVLFIDWSNSHLTVSFRWNKTHVIDVLYWQTDKINDEKYCSYKYERIIDQEHTSLSSIVFTEGRQKSPNKARNSIAGLSVCDILIGFHNGCIALYEHRNVHYLNLLSSKLALKWMRCTYVSIACTQLRVVRK